MDEIDWTNKDFAQNSSFNHINTMTIWNPVLDQRKGGSRREFTVIWDCSGIEPLKRCDSSSCVTLQGPGLRPRRVPGRCWLMPATSSPFDKPVFSYHSPLPARGKNSRVATWQSPWSIQSTARRDWISSYLSYRLIILHAYLNYPTYVS